MIPSKYKKSSDPELVSLCLAGDAKAWEALIMRYKRLIYSIPLRFSLSVADASDVFQSVCLILIEHLHELKMEYSLASWLTTTTSRQCLRVRELGNREPRADDEELEEPEAPEHLEEVHLQIEEQQAIRESVELLPDRCRDLIELLYFDTQAPKYDDVAQRLSIPVSSIGPTRARCLEKLRTILRRRGIK